MEMARPRIAEGGPEALERDLSVGEAAALVPLLSARAAEPRDAERWLNAILSWTSGHPALTARLCHLLIEAGLPAGTQEEIQAFVEERVDAFCQGGAAVEPAVAAVRDRFVGGRQGGAALSLYREILEGGPVTTEAGAPAARELVAAGLCRVRPSGDRWVIEARSPLLSRIFDLAWVRRREEERALGERVRAWKEAGEGPEHLLSGDALTEALTWARGREDVTAAERGFLLASQEEVLRAERRRHEQAQVQATLDLERERARRRLVLISWCTGLSLVIAVLCGGLIWLSRDRGRARQSEEAAWAEARRLKQALGEAQQKLDQAQKGEAQARAQAQAAEAEAGRLREELGGALYGLGEREGRLKEIRGDVQALVKKRITVRGQGVAGEDTGISDKGVEALLLTRGWPGIRRCYPLKGPLPRRLPVQLTVQPDGQVQEAGAEAAGGQRACVEEALRKVPFPRFSGAHWVKIIFVFERP
jgi:hypothetical protein